MSAKKAADDQGLEGPSATEPLADHRLANEVAQQLAELEKAIGYTFRNRMLGGEALVHSSAAAESGATSNQRLEFLGDAVLDLAVSEMMMALYPEASEGELTRMRASLVRARSLARVARAIDLGDRVLLGRGESRSGGAQKDNILADAVEAVIAAVFLDSGYDATREVIERLFQEAVASVTAQGSDHKTEFQELTQRLLKTIPVYRVLDVSGPDHERHYRVEVRLEDEPLATGEGPSRKAAEQEAARQAATLLLEKEDLP